MLFRILRDYDEYQPQVFVDPIMGVPRWKNIGHDRCYTIEEAENMCAAYKKMREHPIVKEFEL